jgi:putative ABC transport system substrate-binding protein
MIYRHLLGFSVAVLLATNASAQSAAKIPRVGYLRYFTQESDRYRDWFLKGLRELGYVIGENIIVEYRYAGDDTAVFSRMAKELVSLNVDVIVTAGTPPIRAVMKETKTIPIVAANMSDPIRAGFAASLRRPGGNLTGVTLATPELAPKRIELLKQVVPNVHRIGVLRNPDNPAHVWDTEFAESTARSLGVSPHTFEARRGSEIPSAFTAMVDAGIDGAFILDDGVFNAARAVITSEAARVKIPLICTTREHAEAGCMMSYGVHNGENSRRAAWYVDKILKGANPAELPIQLPAKFEFVINLKTMQSLGVTVPPLVQALADEVIE